MLKVTTPQAMNEAFAAALNDKRLTDLLSLYEAQASLIHDAAAPPAVGLAAIEAVLSGLIALDGRFVARQRFCFEQDGLAMLRADYVLVHKNGSVILQGSSCELVRLQADGGWRYVIDHAVGASLPSLHDLG